MVGARTGAVRRGRDPLAREEVREIQRVRLLEAAARVVAERGVRGVTVALVVERAGVSRGRLSPYGR